MISCIIFSKDRSMQCDLLLRSLKDHIDFIDKVVVLYKTTSELFEQGYSILKEQNENIEFIKQSDFEKDTKSILNSFNTKYTLPLCDDDVVINKVDKEELKILLSRYDTGLISCVSLRMNEFCDYCYSAQKSMKIPIFLEKDKFLLWNWVDYDPLTDWGYPFAINGTIFNTNYLQKFVQELNFINVNELEGQMNFRRDYGNPLLISFKETKIFNTMQNYVKGNNTITNKDGCDIYSLNKMFLEGQRIKTDNIYGLKMKQVHGPIDFSFYKYGN